jgi:hypothetical protein
MATGCASASLTQSSRALASRHAPTPPARDALALGASALAKHACGYAAIGALVRAGALGAGAALGALSGLDGSLFGYGLVIGGMGRPDRIAQFLDVSERAWNPTLAVVLGGGLAALGSFMKLAWPRLGRPLIAGALCAFAKPVIDARLVLGGTLFGLGWGLAGLCPGPALLGLGSGAPPVVFLAGLFAGLSLQPVPMLAVCALTAVQAAAPSS